MDIEYKIMILNHTQRHNVYSFPKAMFNYTHMLPIFFIKGHLGWLKKILKDPFYHAKCKIIYFDNVYGSYH